MGRAMFATNSGTCPKTEQTSPAYLKKPMSAMSMAQETTTQSFLRPCESAFSTLSAQNQEQRDMNMSSRTYFGSPQA